MAWAIGVILWQPPYGCFYKWEVLFVGVFIRRALLFEV